MSREPWNNNKGMLFSFILMPRKSLDTADKSRTKMGVGVLIMHFYQYPLIMLLKKKSCEVIQPVIDYLYQKIRRKGLY